MQNKPRTPILEIKQFQKVSGEESFYTNIFSNHLECNHKDITTPHKHDFYLSVLFTHGYGTHEIDFITYPIQSGTIFFLKPGQTHNWQLSDNIEGYIFFHSKTFYDSYYSSKSVLDFPFFFSTQNAPFLHLTETQKASVTLIFQNILKEHLEKQAFHIQKTINLIDHLYLDITRWYTQNKTQETIVSHSYILKTQLLEQFIDTHFKTDKLARQYALRMHITPKHLNRMTTNTLGKTTSELITERVLLEAKRILVHKESILTNTADDLGFKDYAYFSRWFKSKTGETPSSFQKRYHQGQNFSG
jgi:AraC-like DNA-binding protein